MPSLYRIWGKVRADDVRDWKRKWARSYFAAGPGKSAESAAWRAALRAELAIAVNADSASILWDLLKCFEHGRHTLLAEEVHAVGFPVAVARLSVEMYRAERRLVIDDASSEPIFPTRGFMAGCSRALALIKVVMLRRMDAYISRHPRVNLELYVDDVELQAVGTMRIVDTLAAAAKDLEEVLRGQLGFPLADDKAQVVASTPELAEEIVSRTGGQAGRATVRAVKLGVELTGGKRQGRWDLHRRARLRKALARQRRLTKFKRMGGNACCVVRRGVIPAATFGKRVLGVSNAELAQLQRLVANTSATNTKGASQALKLLLDGDPAIEANAAPLVEWATAAWDVSAPAYDVVPPAVAGAVAAQHRVCNIGDQMLATGADLAPCREQRGDGDQGAVAGAVQAQHCSPVNGHQPSATGALVAPCDDGSHNVCDLVLGSKLRAKQLHKLIDFANEDARSGSWDTVRGPASAAVLTARRLGWRFNDGTSVTDEYGSIIDMAKVAPASVRSAVERATGKCTAASAAERWGRPEFARGIWVRPIRTAMGRLGLAAKAALRRTWTGGYWSRARLADNALVDSAECERCGAMRDDTYHRVWECKCNDDERNAATTPQLRAEAARASRDDWLFTRGLAPNAWAQLPRPRCDYEEVHVGPDGEKLDEPLHIDGPVFVDGSALWPANPDARRAGWSIVTINAEGKLCGAVYGHLPWGESDEQTPGHAEMYALRRAAELVTGPLVVYTDYREAAEGVGKGSAATTGPRAKHAAHWRAFWTAVEDREYRIVKVKGHITATQVEDDADLRWRRSGNIFADKLAKKGARAHFVNEHWHAALKADKDQEMLANLCTWIGDALSEWPPEKQVRRRAMDRDGMRARRTHRRRMAREVGGHRLFWSRDGWRCRYCGTEARTQSGARRVLDRPCPGHTVARLPRQEKHGPAAHVLWTAEADDTQRQMGADVTWCSVCGAYSSAKLYKLKGRCTGPAQGAALTRLKSLQRLRHPVLGYSLKKPHRATDGFLDAAADRGDVRRQMYDDAMRVHSGVGAATATHMQPPRGADEGIAQGNAMPACDEEDGSRGRQVARWRHQR